MDSQHVDTPQPPATAPLRPSVLLIVVSIINMVVGAVAASVSLVVLELLWPHPISYSSLLLLAWALITIISQYLGTFRRNAQGAWFSALGSALCCVMLHFAIVILRLFTTSFSPTSTVEIWSDEQYFVWPAIGLLSITSFGFNGHWAWRINKLTDGKPSWKPISISLREILAACVVLGLIMIPATYRAHANQSVFRANVAAADAPFPVPGSAQAISYERDRNGLRLGSYTIEEPQLREWLSRSDSEASKHGGRWQELTTAINVTTPSPNRLPWSLSYGNEIVSDGFRVHWQTDSLYHVIAYDRATGKAYYQEYTEPE